MREEGRESSVHLQEFPVISANPPMETKKGESNGKEKKRCLYQKQSCFAFVR